MNVTPARPAASSATTVPFTPRMLHVTSDRNGDGLNEWSLNVSRYDEGRMTDLDYVAYGSNPITALAGARKHEASGPTDGPVGRGFDWVASRLAAGGFFDAANAVAIADLAKFDRNSQVVVRASTGSEDRYFIVPEDQLTSGQNQVVAELQHFGSSLPAS